MLIHKLVVLMPSEYWKLLSLIQDLHILGWKVMGERIFLIG